MRDIGHIEIEGKRIGDGYPCYLAAEVGTTSNGDIETAYKLIEVCADCGLDAVKFQTIGPSEILSDRSVEFEFDTVEGRRKQNMLEMLNELTYTQEEWQSMADHARRHGLAFFSTVDYLRGIELLENIGVDAYKISAWDTNYYPLMRKVAETGKSMVVDLGPSTFTETLQILDWSNTYGSGQVMFLQNYHTPDPSHMNLRAITYLKSALSLPVGFSSPDRFEKVDHLALALGANMIEKRLTLNRKDLGHHHFISLEPHELKDWVKSIRETEKILGRAQVIPSQDDLDGAKKYFRSICTLKPIRAGEPFSTENLDGKRPGTGIPTVHLPLFWGRRATRDLSENTLLTWEDL